MLDQTPSFEIYHDPPDSDRTSTPIPYLATKYPARLVLSEIKLPNWGTATRCGSALKHEILASQPESSSSSSGLPSGSSSEESKENIPSRPLKTSSHKKKNRTFSTTNLRCNASACSLQTPLSTLISPPNSRSNQKFEGVLNWAGANVAREARMS